MYPLVPDQEQEPDQKKIPGIPPQGNDSSRVADNRDIPAQPAPIHVPGRYGKWRYEITRQFRPEAEEGSLIIAQNNPSVRAAIKAAICRLSPHVHFRGFPFQS
jgi:hypothetical protein